VTLLTSSSNGTFHGPKCYHWVHRCKNHAIDSVNFSECKADLEKQVLDSSPVSPGMPSSLPLTFDTTRIAQPLRALRGRNGALLVKADDGRHFVQKFHSSLNSRDILVRDLLFNEAFASQLGTALDLSFPAWSELIGDSSDSRHSSFGSELISGDIFEYLPGGWYRNVENSADAYRCLLFDLWCNHVDSRQAVFQARSPRAFHAFFFDHDQMFSADDRAPLTKRIARSRCLDLRIYKHHFGSLSQDLRQFADRIRLLARHKLLRNLENSVPATWGSLAHREQAVSGLERRAGQLNSYIEAIVQFAAGIRQSETT
jgi:hypothetical protein